MRVRAAAGLFGRLRRPMRAQISVLLATLATALGIFGFVAIADEVNEGDTRAVDRFILMSLREPTDHNDPLGPPWLEEAARDVTALGSLTVLSFIALAVLLYLLGAGLRGHALLLTASLAGGLLVMHLLKRGYERPRPDLVSHLVHVQTLSFPSGHAMLSAVAYLTLGALLAQTQVRRWQGIYFLLVAIILTVLVGASRVYLGVHWPSDVLAGWCAGMSWALFCWLVAAWLRSRHALREPAAVAAEQDGAERATGS